MKYRQIAIEVGGLRHIREIPCEPVIIRIWLQNDGGLEVKQLGDIHIVCPRDDDIVLTARPSGKFGGEQQRTFFVNPDGEVQEVDG